MKLKFGGQLIEPDVPRLFGFGEAAFDSHGLMRRPTVMRTTAPFLSRLPTRRP